MPGSELTQGECHKCLWLHMKGVCALCVHGKRSPKLPFPTLSGSISCDHSWIFSLTFSIIRKK